MIINLTQHPASEEQLAVGVVDVPADTTYAGKTLKELLTFEDLPSKDHVLEVAEMISDLAEENFDPEFAMIGGAPFLMGPLESALKANGIQPLYAFSCRES